MRNTKMIESAKTKHTEAVPFFLECSDFFDQPKRVDNTSPRGRANMQMSSAETAVYLREQKLKRGRSTRGYGAGGYGSGTEWFIAFGA